LQPKPKRTIAKVVKIVGLHDEQNDFEYWNSQPIKKRLEAFAELRRFFIQFHYGSEPRLQRVLKVVKQTRG
jgi:hypothetical protein